jgi:lipoprotein-anchoring transpeptidase ErfK/SrfK
MMFGLRVSALLMGAAFVAAGAAAPASAQSLQWGLWGEPPERGARSNLGAAPTVAATLSQGGGRPSISPKTPKTASFQNGFAPGSIVIDTAGRKLYYTLSKNSAYVYPIAVGKQGFAWTGVERVSRIEDWPDWIPPAEMRQRKPGLPVRMTGGLRNPLGAKAIYLGNTLYRIHGTNDSKSIGSASSSGCFRMHNEHVVHLAEHVNAQTTVYVMKRLPASGVVMPPASYTSAAKKPVTPPAAEAPPAVQPEAQAGTPEQGTTASPPAEVAPAAAKDQGI